MLTGARSARSAQGISNASAVVDTTGHSSMDKGLRSSSVGASRAEVAPRANASRLFSCRGCRPPKLEGLLWLLINVAGLDLAGLSSTIKYSLRKLRVSSALGILRVLSEICLVTDCDAVAIAPIP